MEQRARDKMAVEKWPKRMLVGKAIEPVFIGFLQKLPAKNRVKTHIIGLYQKKKLTL